MSAASLPDPPLTALVLRLFGAFALERNGRPLPRTRTRKEEWLLALLVLRHPEALNRRFLAGLLWAESAEARVLQYLRWQS